MSSISSLSASSGQSYASKLFSKLDTDKSGGVSKDEFTSGRPSEVSETQASALFDKLDSSAAGSLSESDMEAMEKSKKSKGASLGSNLDDTTLQALMQSLSAASSSSTSASTETTSIDDMIAAMDTDENGSITKEEFLAARPDDVSEEMASNLWDKFDKEGTGSLSTSDLKTAMAAGRSEGPHGPPPPPGDDDEDDDDTTVSSTSSTGSTDELQELLTQILNNMSKTSDTTATATSSSSTQSAAYADFLDAVKSYDASAGYGASQNVLSTLMSLA